MRNPIVRKLELLAVVPILAACFAAPARAQFQNPIQAAKDAWNKAKQQSAPQPAAAPSPAPAPAPAPASTSTQPEAAQPGSAAATSATSADPQGAAAPWTPPSDTSTGMVAAPSGPLDPSKLPDVAGIHIGATSTEITPILQKLHAGAPSATAGPPLQTQANGKYLPSGVLLSASLAPSPSLASDNFQMEYTFEPNKPQTVYFMWRGFNYGEHPIAKQVIVDALRQKYGKETQATSNSSLGITAMVWLFDEQGHVVYTPPNAPATNGTPFGCQGDYASGDGLNLYLNMMRNDVNNQLPAATYCDSLIVLHVALDGVSEVGVTRTVLLDSALLRRSAIALGEGQKAEAAKQNQIDLQKANQAKPSL